MPPFKRVEDKWKHLRAKLFGNSEPSVVLEAVTMPVEIASGFGGIPEWCKGYWSSATETHESGDDTCYLRWPDIESLPALAASTSYGSKDRIDTPEKAAALNRKLIELDHDTPLEAIQINMHISGISKTCGAQLSRYRHSGHVSASRRFKKAEPRFIYTIFDDMDESGALNEIWEEENVNKFCYVKYLDKLGRGVRKEAARQVLPVSYATERSMWVNVRSLRHMFKQRLAADTETELRRLAWMIYDMVSQLMPSLFDDIATTNGGN